MTTRITGIAYRAGSDLTAHPEAWSVPAEVHLTVDFDRPIGVAELTKQDDGTITADCTVLDSETRYLASHPYLGVSARKGTHVKVVGLAVIKRNVDGDIPPYQVMTDNEVLAALLQPPAVPSNADRLPVGYRFTLPGFGHCEITINETQTAEQFTRDEQPRFDYVVRCGPDRVKKMMTHELVTGAWGVQEGWG